MITALPNGTRFTHKDGRRCAALANLVGRVHFRELLKENADGTCKCSSKPESFAAVDIPKYVAEVDDEPTEGKKRKNKSKKGKAESRRAETEPSKTKNRKLSYNDLKGNHKEAWLALREELVDEGNTNKQARKHIQGLKLFVTPDGDLCYTDPANSPYTFVYEDGGWTTKEN